MPIAVGLFRIAVVVAGILGVALEMSRSGVLSSLVYFTVQSNIALVVCFAAAAWAALRRSPGPPPLVKGGATVYILITGLIYNFVLTDGPGSGPTAPGEALGGPLPFVDSSDLLHIATPITAAADFVLFDEHGRMRWRNAAVWLGYPLAYVTFTTLRGIVLPDSPYPYFFIDVSRIGYDGLALNTLVYGIGFLLLGLVLIGADRLIGLLAARWRRPAARAPVLHTNDG